MSVALAPPSTPYSDHREYVLAVIAGRCRWVAPGDREALYHEAYASMLDLERSGRLRSEAMHPRQLRAYLATAAVRKALDERKSAERRLTSPLEQRAEHQEDTARPVDERAAARVDSAAIREILSELPERQRAVWCFGCARGGRVYDLASLLAGGPWGRSLRGKSFARARELVAAAL